MSDGMMGDAAGSGAAGSGAVAGGRVLLVDDEPAFRRLGGDWLRRLGHEVVVAADAEEAMQRFREARPEVVLLDLVMPPRMTPQAGLELVPALAGVPVVVMTAHADHELALEAAALGAWDFLAKPVEPELLRFVVERALRKARLERELRELREAGGEGGNDLGLVGASAEVERLRGLVRRLGPTGISVVVLGPTGTGKELVARALHATSPRHREPFVAVHCGALPAELLESELFGHLRGAFTGAHRDQEGVLAAAHRGTLFLDEVGEMPPPMQVKLLRFLQEGTYSPVGSREVRRAEVRVVSATHRDLEAMVAEGGFREDLFYRLKGFVLRTPPLSARRGDVAILASVFLRRAAPGARLLPDALAWLAARDWPGNVRELRALVETAAALAGPGEAVDAAVLRFASGEEPGEAGGAEASAPSPAAGARGSLDEAIAALEVRMLRDTLEATGNNQSEAARRLGISRVGLIKKLGRLGLR